MKLEFSWQIFEISSNITFHQNPSSGSRVVPFGHTDMTKLVVVFHNFANGPKNHTIPYHLYWHLLRNADQQAVVFRTNWETVPSHKQKAVTILSYTQTQKCAVLKVNNSALYVCYIYSEMWRFGITARPHKHNLKGKGVPPQAEVAQGVPVGEGSGFSRLSALWRW